MLTHLRFPGAKIFLVCSRVILGVVTVHFVPVRVTSRQPRSTQEMKAVVREPYIIITEARAEVPRVWRREEVEGQIV